MISKKSAMACGYNDWKRLLCYVTKNENDSSSNEKTFLFKCLLNSTQRQADVQNFSSLFFKYKNLLRVSSTLNFLADWAKKCLCLLTIYIDLIKTYKQVIDVFYFYDCLRFQILFELS